MIRINKNLVLFSGLFLFLGTILLYTLQKFSPLIGHATYYCQSFIETHMIPVPYYLSFIPIGLLSFLLSISLIKFFILSIKISSQKNKLNGNATAHNASYSVIRRLGLEDKTFIIRSDKYFAFCLGVRKPKIYISTSLVKTLSDKELEAVLRHEQYHLENYDSLTQIIASTAHSLFPFFPLIGDLIKKYRVDREIKADLFAAEKVGDPSYLISALRKLLSFPTPQIVAVSAIADHDTLEPRIHSLLRKKYLKRQFRIKHLLITLLSTLVIGVIIGTPVHAKEVHHEEHDVMMLCTDGGCMNSCTNDKNLNKLYSEIPTAKTSKPNSSQPYTPLHQ